MKVLTSTFVGAGNGFNTLSPRAQAFYTAIKTLEPSIRQAGAAIVDLGGSIGQLIPVFAQVLAATVSFASSPLGKAAFLAAIAIGTLTAALAVLEATGIKAAIKAVYRFIGSLYAIPAATGVARIAIIGLKLAITGIFIGAILVGLDYVIGKIFGIGDAARQSIGDIKQLASELDGLASSQDFIGLATKNKQAQNEVIIAERLLEVYQKIDKTGSFDKLTEKQKTFLSQYGTRNPLESGIDFANKKLADAMTKRGMTQKALNNAQKLQDDEKARRAKELTKLVKVDLNEDDKKKQNLESYYKLEDDLAKAVAEGEIDKANMLFEHRKNLMDNYYDLQDARANSFQKATIRFQREVANIEMERQKNVLNAQNAVKKAEGSVAGGAGGGGGMPGLTKYITGDPSQKGKGYQADHGGSNYHDHLQFATREAAVAAYDKLTKNGIKVTEFKGFGAGVTGPHSGPGSAHHTGMAFDVPGAQRPVGQEPAMSKQVRALVMGQAGLGAVRGVTGNESRDINAAQKTQIELDKENLALQYGNILALEKQKVATENYVAEIMPVAELQLQNQLQDRRNQLQLAGVSDAVLEYEMAKTKATMEQATAEKALQALKEKRMKTPLTDIEKVQLGALQKGLDKLKADHPAFYAGLAGKQAGQIQSAYSSNMGSLKNSLQLAGIIDPYGEQKQKYMQGGQSEQQADEQVKMQKQLDTATRLRDSYRELASTIGTSFGDAFKGIITGSMTAQQALAGFFQNLSNYFADMVSKMIAEYLKMQVIKGLTSLIPGLGGMFGGGGGSSGFFGAGAPDAVAGGGIFSGAGPYQFANGGIAAGGFRAFATGGIVTGPTLGLVGEGRYNEAVIPLPDGRSVPVDLGGMSGGMASAPITVNVSVDAKGSEVQGDSAQGAALGRVIAASVQSELIKQKRPGGLLAK